MELKHYDFDGRARFVTFCTHRKIPILTSDKLRRIVIEAIQKVRSEYHLQLIGYVVMPEHVHLVVIPPENVRIGPVVGEIKRLAAREILNNLRDISSNLLPKLEATRSGCTKTVLWQRRCYDHNCRSESSMWEKVNYCHNNPVFRRIVNHPAKWRWSSHRYYNGLSGVEIVMDDCIGNS